MQVLKAIGEQLFALFVYADSTGSRSACGGGPREEAGNAGIEQLRETCDVESVVAVKDHGGLVPASEPMTVKMVG